MAPNSETLDGPWDLVVVGPGAAGLSSASSLLDSYEDGGARAAILDRASVDQRGGSTAWTTAGLRLDNDMQLNQDWGDIVRRTAGPAANDAYTDAFYEHALDTLNWLRMEGICVSRLPGGFPGIASSLGVPLKFSHYMQGGGRAIVDTLSEYVQARGAETYYEVDLVGLDRQANGPVTAVRVRTADRVEHRMAARTFVLASGGFEGNQEMLGRYVAGGEVLEPVSPGTKVNTGKGIEAAVEVGAALAGQYAGSHLEPVDPRCEPPEPLVSSWTWGILVDRDGNRFLDEAETSFDLQFDFVAKAVHARRGLAYAINDAGVRAAPFFEPMNYTNVPPITANSANTIEELSVELDIDPIALRRTVDEYNAASVDVPYDGSVLDGKRTEGITPPKSHWAQPLIQAPFEAWPAKPQICFTFGGIKVDGSAHVVGEDEKPIEGLCAAGEITGIFCGETNPSGSSVLRSLTFGRIAGQQVAASLRAATVS